MANAELTGVQKAAVLLITLGPEKSASIFKHLKEEEIEELILDRPQDMKLVSHGEVGKITYYRDAQTDYIRYIMKSIKGNLTGLRIAIDCANGSASATAKRLFEGLGANVYVINSSPDGTNINDNCGSTHIGNLMQFVVDKKCHAGLAFDGDADRLLAVDENGKIVDGDKIMAIVGNFMKEKGTLKQDTIVVTVMSNLGFFLMAKDHDIKTEQTKVGDRYVLERMKEIGASLGGEQSGHVIFLDENTTGDGLLSALHLLQVMVETGRPLSELSTIMEELPQALVNAKVANHKKEHYLEYPEIAQAIKELEDKFAGEGRVLIRPSGTEPLVRVMIEGKDKEQIQTEAEHLANLIQDIMF